MRMLLICLLGMIACGDHVSSIPKVDLSHGSTPIAGANSTGNVIQLDLNGTPTTENANALYGIQTEKKMTEESTNTRLSLTATVEKTENKLVISYEVENKSNQILYLGDRLIDYEGSEPRISEDQAYIFFDEPKTLNVVRANLPLPKTIRVAVKVPPYVRPIAAGMKERGRIEIPLPAKEYSPYFGYSNPENSELRNVTEIRLLLGWTEFRQGMEISEESVGGQKVFAIRGKWTGPYQHIAEKVMPVSVPVLVAASDFERQMPLQ